MDHYREALQVASKRGYLTVGSGGRWLDLEVMWRRRCEAERVPAVVVCPREKYADVYMLMMGFPHRNPSKAQLAELLSQVEELGVPSRQIEVMHGERGHHDRFTGISVSDVPVEDATKIAPHFWRGGLELVD